MSEKRDPSANGIEKLNPRHWTPHVILGAVFVALLYHWDYTTRYVGILFNAFKPVIAALILALILNAPLKGIESLLQKWKPASRMKAKLRSVIGFIAVVLLFAGVMFLLGKFVIPMVIDMLRLLVGYISSHPDLLSQVRDHLKISAETWSSVMGQFSRLIETYAQDLITSLVSITGSTLSLLLSVILAFYFLAGRNQIRDRLFRAVRALFKRPRAERILSTTRLSVNTLSKWFGYQCREALIMGAMTVCGMLILHMPYAAPMACLAGLMQMIPYVGGWISFIIGFLSMLTVDLHTAIVFGIMIFIFQQVEGMLINPHLVGTKVGLSPYLSLSAVIIGSALYGPVGMFLAVPICSVLYTLGKEFIRRKESTPADAGIKP